MFCYLFKFVFVRLYVSDSFICMCMGFSALYIMAGCKLPLTSIFSTPFLLLLSGSQLDAGLTYLLLALIDYPSLSLPTLKDWVAVRLSRCHYFSKSWMLSICLSFSLFLFTSLSCRKKDDLCVDWRVVEAENSFFLNYLTWYHEQL